jgi:hypothetical protein
MIRRSNGAGDEGEGRRENQAILHRHGYSRIVTMISLAGSVLSCLSQWSMELLCPLGSVGDLCNIDGCDPARGGFSHLDRQVGIAARTAKFETLPGQVFSPESRCLLRGVGAGSLPPKGRPPRAVFGAPAEDPGMPISRRTARIAR